MSALSASPFLLFYRFLWRTNRPLLARTFVFNYVAPIVLELLPWWLNRRKVGNKLRSTRIKLNHNMVTAEPYKPSLVADFVTRALLFASLETMSKWLGERVNAENTVIIKRLVFERLLYADPLAVQHAQAADAHWGTRLADDFLSSLHFFNKYLPSLLSSIGAFIIDGLALYRKREAIDPLALLYPIIIALISHAVSWLLKSRLTKKVKRMHEQNEADFESYLTTAVERMVDIQMNNLQPMFLLAFDRTAQSELAHLSSVQTVLARSLHTLKDMSFISYLLELAFVHRIMARQALNYRQFTKLQQEIEHVYRLCRRTWALLRHTRGLFREQARVLQLLALPSFRDETLLDPADAAALLGEFRSLVLDALVFAYAPTAPNVIDFRLPEPAPHAPSRVARALARTGSEREAYTALSKVEFEPGKVYGVIGVNTAGKSTLAKLILRIYSPQQGEIVLNGLPYSELPRVSLRTYTTYVPQQALIFDGTITENIRVANPHASEDEVIAAASASGLLELLGLAEGSSMPRTPRSSFKRSRGAKVKSPTPSTSGESSSDEAVGSFGDLDALSEPYGSRFAANMDSQSDSSSDDSASSMAPSEGLLHHSVSLAALDTQRHTSPHTRYAVRKSGDDERSEALRLRNNESLRALSTPAQLLTKRVHRDTGGALAQAIALARLFVRPHAKLAIIDEAVSHMDPLKLRQIVFPQLFEFSRTHGICLIIITHNLSVLRELDHIYVMHQGRFVHSGSHAQLLEGKAKLYMQFMFPHQRSESGDVQRLSQPTPRLRAPLTASDGVLWQPRRETTGPAELTPLRESRVEHADDYSSNDDDSISA